MRKITVGEVEFDLKLVMLVVVSVMLPMLNLYGYGVEWLGELRQFGLFFVIPALIVVFLFREKLREYGVQIENVKKGLKYSAVMVLGMVPVLMWISSYSEMQSYYANNDSLQQMLITTGLDMWGWEFLWRGFLLFGLAKIVGAGNAIWLQAVPFSLFHLGKPGIETITTLFGGVVFGYIAWKTKSMIYPFLIHWFMVLFVILLVSNT